MKIHLKESEVKELLIRKGYSQRSFGKKVGISSPYFSQLLSGERHPAPQMAKRICDGLEVEFDEIFFINSGYKSKQKKSA